MTPLAPRTPNTAVAEASLRIEMSCTSFGVYLAELTLDTIDKHERLGTVERTDTTGYG